MKNSIILKAAFCIVWSPGPSYIEIVLLKEVGTSPRITLQRVCTKSPF
jgi:hypothetical protein